MFQGVFMFHAAYLTRLGWQRRFVPFFLVLGVFCGILPADQDRPLVLVGQQVFQVPEPGWGWLVGGVEDEAGLVSVLDRKACRVLRFNARGEWLGSWGRGGQGPGDLKDPFCIAPAEENGLWIAGAQVSVTLFDAVGRMVQAVDLHTALPRVREIKRLGPDLLLGVVEGGSSGQVVTALDRQGRTRGEPYVHLPDPAFLQQGAMVDVNVPACTILPLFASSGTRHALARSDRYRIQILDGNGRVLRVVIGDEQPEPLREAERAQIRRRVERSFANVARNPEMRELVDRSIQQIMGNLPSNKVVLKSLAISGNLLVVLLMDRDLTRTQGPQRVDFFDLGDGRFLGRFTLKTAPLFWGKQSLYLFDPEGERLVRHGFSL